MPPLGAAFRIMAITNAQQYQQLVNKPANGKRPGLSW